MSGEISRTTKTLYGLGSVASGVKETTFNVFLLFYYTQVAGLSGTLAGMAIFIALLMDAISDPAVGYWSDRLKSRWGRRHPFIYASALPMGIAFYFLFNPPTESSQTMLFGWMLVWAVLVRFFMTFFTVPSTALTAEMTENYDERTSITSYRVLAGWCGGLVFATLGYLVYFAPSELYADGRLDPAAYQGFALVGAVMIVVAIMICALGTHHLIPRLHEVHERGIDSKGLKQDFANILGNKPFLILAAAVLVCASAIGFTEVIGLYMFTYFWGLSTNELSVLTFSSLVGTVLAFLTVSKVTTVFDKRPVALAAVAIVMFLYPSIIGLRLLGVLPDNDSPLLMGILIFNSIVTIFAVVTLTIILVSMIADTIDSNELKTGQRQEAIFISVYTFSQKATSGVGGFIAGMALEAIAFPKGVEASVVPAETLQSLGLTVASIMFAFWFAGFLVLRKYPITRAHHAEIVSELALSR